MSKADSTLTKTFEYLSEMDLISQKKTNIYYQIFIVAVAVIQRDNPARFLSGGSVLTALQHLYL